MRKNGFKFKAYIYMVSILAITLWGISYIWTDRLIQLGIPVFYFVFVRIFVAGLCLLLLNTVTRQMQRIHRKDLPKFMLLALFEPFIYFLAESYGIKLTGSPTLSSMVIATIPIFSVAAGFLFFRERINWVNAIGIVLAIGGICLVVMSHGKVGPNFIWGIILLLIAVISEVGHASVTKSLSGNYSSQVIVMYQFLIGSIYLFPLFLFKGLEDFEPRYLSYEVWTPIICLAILCSSMAFSLWVNTIKHLGVAKSSIFTALIPVASALSAWALGYEFLTMRQWGGVLLSAVGVIMSQYCMKQQK
ncbi:MAG: DMT family transporter [Bacteroidetes bacterium]|jgi:drug/metabolite transporter (DMT)-like permease|uniref:DMT family transporter n=1 Tax=Candidatus Cryptobacteroides intestinavium TaxID=2840766 RepID=A0A9D9EVD4_9BACT|nr:DMT family transporter [Candidatus Cryptobacteroides intestinavium]